MLDVQCREDLNHTLEFAIDNGCAGALLARLLYLARYGGEGGRCVLTRDFALHSFGFAHHRPDGSCWLVGCLVYSGPGQPAGGCGPALTVQLEEGDPGQHRWSTHT